MRRTVYITSPMAAKLAGINPSTLKKLCSDNRVPGAEQPGGPRTHYRIDLEAYVASLLDGALREYRHEPTVVPLRTQHQLPLDGEEARAVLQAERWFDVVTGLMIGFLLLAFGSALAHWGW